MLKDLALVTEAARAAKHPVLMGAIASSLPEALRRRQRREGLLQRDPAVHEGREMIRHEIRGHTAFITIDNPPANTWTPEDLRPIEGLVGELNADRLVYAAVITGSGPSSSPAART
jgi:hypothetical protein